VFNTIALLPAWKNPKVKITMARLNTEKRNRKSPKETGPRNLVINMFDIIDKGIITIFTVNSDITCFNLG
jgi:hypothetical protein